MITIGEYSGFRRPKKWCDGKERFDSFEAAGFSLFSLRTAAKAGTQNVDDVDYLRIYPCDEGKDNVRHWHIGHWRRIDRSPIERVKRGEEKYRRQITGSEESNARDTREEGDAETRREGDEEECRSTRTQYAR